MRGKIFLGRYEVQRQLGEGGMGRVYLARQTDLQRLAVIKVMHDHVASDQKFQERFQREMLLMAKFQHPYAVTLYDAAINDVDGPCIVMEYVRGEPLDAVLKRNERLSPFRVSRILGQLCEVLHAANQLGIIHRDLKPSNLMVLDADTPYEKIKVMDFGLAKLMTARSLKQLVDSGNEFVIGTPAYVCPEQVRGDEMDHRGDIYSVGVMLYELLTGKLPFEGLATMDMLLAHAVEPPPPINQGSWVPKPVEQVIMACLAKKPEERPQSAMDLSKQYDLALKAPEEEAAETVLEVPRPEAEGPPPIPDMTDPSMTVYQMQAWMPESLAAYKLTGFIEDAGGQVLESVPGKIRVMLGATKSSAYQVDPGRLSWFGIGSAKGSIEVELLLHQANSDRANNLWVTVIVRFAGRNLPRGWKNHCDQIYRDLRGYLMGTSMQAARR
jgi:serine/threonine-protein kinase